MCPSKQPQLLGTLVPPGALEVPSRTGLMKTSVGGLFVHLKVSSSAELQEPQGLVQEGSEERPGRQAGTHPGGWGGEDVPRFLSEPAALRP